MTSLALESQEKPAAEHRTISYIPGLDGLRALSVGAVVLYHADLRPVRGGFLGVDVFFVLSGFLITSLLLAELEQHSRIDFRRFYVRRAKRLLPALFAVLLATTVLCATSARDALRQTLHDILPCLFYFQNWSYVAAKQSYFEALGRPPLLRHLWSLSVEEQFYLAWPLIAWGAFRVGRRKAVLGVSLMLAIASAAAMTWLAVTRGMPNPNDASRIYFGTDTHASGLVIGASLAALPNPKPSDVRPSRAVSWALDAVGVAAIALVVFAFARVSDLSEPLYRAGFFAFSVIVAVAVAVVRRPDSKLGTLLGMQPLRWLGERSYGIYLWHWPRFMVTRPDVDMPWRGTGSTVVRIALVLVLAELSYRLIEDPIRRGFGDKSLNRPASASVAKKAGVFVTAALGIVLAVCVPSQFGAAAIAQAAPLSEQFAEAMRVEATEESAPKVEAALVDAGSLEDAGDAARAATNDLDTSALLTKYATVHGFGDSVLLGASPKVRKLFKRFQLEADSARHFDVLYKSVMDCPSPLAGLVIVHTGNNGPLHDSGVRWLLKRLKNAERVILVNNSLPPRFRFAADNNELYVRMAAEFPNVRIADWAAASEGHPEYFIADQIHVNPVGAERYAGVVAATALAP